MSKSEINPEIVCMVCGEIIFASSDDVKHCDCHNSTCISFVDDQWVVGGQDLAKIGVIRDGKVINLTEIAQWDQEI